MVTKDFGFPHRRTAKIVQQIKEWIVNHELKPGDRLPGEKQLIAEFELSKGTIREAMRVLEAQGLIYTKTGPGGGCFVGENNVTIATEALGNYFYFQDIHISDIYEIRKQLEPQMAVSVIGILEADDYQSMEDIMRLYSLPARNMEEEFEQRLAELDFHGVLVKKCPNKLLGFYCQFLHSMLKNLAVCQKIYTQKNPKLREQGLLYQLDLIKALRERDAKTVRKIMYDHMCFAQDYMESVEAKLTRQFI